MKGHIFGFHHHAISWDVPSSPLYEARRAGTLLRMLRPLLGLESGARVDTALGKHDRTRDSLLIALIDAIEMAGQVPVFARHVVPGPQKNGTPAGRVIWLESVSPDYTLGALRFIAAALAGIGPGDRTLPERLRQAFLMHRDSAPAMLRYSTNIRHLITAARAEGIPLRCLPNDILQYGVGAASVWMKSSITSRSNAVSVELVRDKNATHRLLAAAGLPVARQAVARDVAEAVAAARRIGFPVVMKPRALDGGVGVTTGITDPAGVAGAFAAIAALSQQAVVERHLPGAEYRFLHAEGVLLSVHERRPAHVVGNGRDRLTTLIAAENHRRAAAPQTGYSNIAIKIEPSAEDFLRRRGLDWSHVPAEGEAFRLFEVPKIRNGGEVRLLPLAEVHPDVRAAVARAVRIVRLDVAGVDYITTDIRRSWRETGGAITEVNARPQINRFAEYDIHRAFLRRVLPASGRLPTVLITGDLTGIGPLLAGVAERMGPATSGLGLILPEPAMAGPLRSRVAAIATPDNPHAVICDRRVRCLLVAMRPEAIRAHGMPLQCFDLAAVVPMADFRLLSLLQDPAIRPHLVGPILMPAFGPTMTLAMEEAFAIQGVRFHAGVQALTETLAHALTRASGRRG